MLVLLLCNNMFACLGNLWLFFVVLVFRGHGQLALFVCFWFFFWVFRLYMVPMRFFVPLGCNHVHLALVCLNKFVV